MQVPPQARQASRVFHQESLLNVPLESVSSHDSTAKQYPPKMDGNLAKESGIHEIYKLIENREKIEKLKFRIAFASRAALQGSPFWQWIRREYSSKCDALLTSKGSDEERRLVLERLASNVKDIENLVHVPAEYLDRIYLKSDVDLDVIVTAVRELKCINPNLFNQHSRESYSFLLPPK